MSSARRLDGVHAGVDVVGRPRRHRGRGRRALLRAVLSACVVALVFAGVIGPALPAVAGDGAKDSGDSGGAGGSGGAGAGGLVGPCSMVLEPVELPYPPCFRVDRTITVTCPGGSPPFYSALDINDLGDICGYRLCGAGVRKAVVWPREGGMLQPPFPAGASSSEARAINNGRWATGMVSLPTSGFGGWHGVMWLWNIVTNELLLVPPPLFDGDPGELIQPEDLNDAMDVVGWLIGPSSNDYANYGPYAFRWRGGEFEIFPFVDPLGVERSEGYRTNAHGDIFGTAGYRIGGLPNELAFVDAQGLATLPPYDGWTAMRPAGFADSGAFVAYTSMSGNPGVWIGLLGTRDGYLCELPGIEQPQGTRRISPYAINNAGDVVGYQQYNTGGGQFAMLWRNGVAHRLVRMVIAAPWPATYNGGTPTAISENGQIVIPSSPIYHLVPAPPPPGDLNHDCRVGFQDLLLMLSRWGTAGEGDLNGDGVIDTADLWMLFDHWNP
ncbi:MAG: hypothetical protein KF817_15020 [Phycisphaeraceae bacterium]|nr:hypothetical protein [Phycisphaeraceae bacterium]